MTTYITTYLQSKKKKEMSEVVGEWLEGRNYGESGDMRPMVLRWYLPSNITNYKGGKKE
jgi:hypothetical protein